MGTETSANPVQQISEVKFPEQLIAFLNSPRVDSSISLNFIKYHLLFDQQPLEDSGWEMWLLTEKNYLIDTEFRGKAFKAGDKDYFLQACTFQLVGGIWQLGVCNFNIDSEDLKELDCPMSLITLAKKLSSTN